MSMLIQNCGILPEQLEASVRRWWSSSNISSLARPRSSLRLDLRLDLWLTVWVSRTWLMSSWATWCGMLAISNIFIRSRLNIFLRYPGNMDFSWGSVDSVHCVGSYWAPGFANYLILFQVCLKYFQRIGAKYFLNFRQQNTWITICAIQRGKRIKLQLIKCWNILWRLWSQAIKKMKVLD